MRVIKNPTHIATSLNRDRTRVFFACFSKTLDSQGPHKGFFGVSSENILSQCGVYGVLRCFSKDGDMSWILKYPPSGVPSIRDAKSGPCYRGKSSNCSDFMWFVRGWRLGGSCVGARKACARRAARRQARKHRLCCDRETKLARNKKEAPAAADILPHQACPEKATARPNRHCYGLWAPFGGK